MDEDFPSYRDIRKVFLNKQQQAEKDERRSQTLPRRRANQPPVSQKPPTPVSPKVNGFAPKYKPLSSHAPAHNTMTSSVNIDSPQKPRRSFSQFNQESSPGTMSVPVHHHQPATPPSMSVPVYHRQPATPPSMSVPAHHHQPDTPASMYAPARHHQAATPPSARRQNSITQLNSSNYLNTDQQARSQNYREVPVYHVKETNKPTNWQHVTPNRDAVKYRPPMSIKIPSHNHSVYSSDGAPKVVITSNSPQSPQKAVYRESGDQSVHPFITSASSNQASPGFISMASRDNQPRRRRSYAEIMIKHDSLPSTLQRSVSQYSQGSVLSDGLGEDIELFPRQRRYNTLGSFRRRPQQSSPPAKPAWQRASSVPPQEHGFARVNLHRPTMNQMLYAAPSPGQNCECNQS